MKPTILFESIPLTEGVTIDKETRTVRQRLITAGMSKNRRLYTESVLQQAAQLFEGVQTYANHPSKSDMKDRPERNVRDLTGWIADVRFEEGALVGTRHFTRNQAGSDVWELVVDITEGRAPSSLLGASINAVGSASKAENESGAYVAVEAITGVVSVDDVTTPAAGGGFIQESDPDLLLQMVLESMSYEHWFESRPDYIRRLQNEMKKVRQTEALKAARAEAERFKADLSSLKTRLSEVEQQYEATAAEAEAARRALLIEQALRASGLPSAWETTLREQLENADPNEWRRIINAEKAKAKSAGQRVPVTGASQRVNSPVPKTPSRSRFHEAYQQIESPEQFREFINRVKSGEIS